MPNYLKSSIIRVSTSDIFLQAGGGGETFYGVQKEGKTAIPSKPTQVRS